MHDTTFYEKWGWLISLIIVFGLLAWFSYYFYCFFMRAVNKDNPDPSKHYTLKDYIKWLFEGIWPDIFAFLRVSLIVVLWIVAIAVGIVLLYFIWNAISLGIDQMSVKGILIIIAILLFLIYLKKGQETCN